MRARSRREGDPASPSYKLIEEESPTCRQPRWKDFARAPNLTALNSDFDNPTRRITKINEHLNRILALIWEAEAMDLATSAAERGSVAVNVTDQDMGEAAELNHMVDGLFNELTSKLTAMTTEIMAKLDDMERRLDNLEVGITTPKESAETS